MKSRLYNIDILRIVCCFAVVLIHVAGVVWYDYNMYSFDWKVATFFDSLSRFAVPVFYMISGMLFLSREKIDIKKIYSKNIFKILLIIAIWLPIHAIVSHYRYGNSINSFASLIDVFRGTISNQFQFWFLFPLISMYIMLPILKKISEDKKVEKYYLILFFIFQIIRQTLSPYLGSGAKLGLYNLFTPDMILGYYGYFLLGHYLYTYEINKKEKNISYILGIISVVITTIVTIVGSYNSNSLYEYFFGYFNIATFFASIAIFNFFKYEIKNDNLSIKLKNCITKISDLTMGVYIFHNLIKWGLEYINVSTDFAPAIVSVPLLSILIFVLSIIITFVIKKIPFIGKHIV